MNVVKLIRNVGTVKLIRPGMKGVRLENTGGVVLYGASDASQIKIKTHLTTYYQLKKQC